MVPTGGEYPDRVSEDPRAAVGLADGGRPFTHRQSDNGNIRVFGVVGGERGVAVITPEHYERLTDTYANPRTQLHFETHIAECLKEVRRRRNTQRAPEQQLAWGGLNPYTDWFVGMDSAITVPRDDGYTWDSLDIVFPAYFFSESAVNEVKRTVEILSSNYRMRSIPGQTGLHVHVGRGMDGFNIGLLRNFTAFVYTFEPQLNQIHSELRLKMTAWCGGVRKESVLGVRLPQMTQRKD